MEENLSHATAHDGAPSGPDFGAAVEAKKGLVIGLGSGAVIAGVIGLVLGNWIVAVALGLVLGVVIGRKNP